MDPPSTNLRSLLYFIHSYFYVPRYQVELEAVHAAPAGPTGAVAVEGLEGFSALMRPPFSLPSLLLCLSPRTSGSSIWRTSKDMIDMYSRAAGGRCCKACITAEAHKALWNLNDSSSSSRRRASARPLNHTYIHACTHTHTYTHPYPFGGLSNSENCRDEWM